jgi:hypothetical protein
MDNKVMVCANGKMFDSTRSLTTNTWTFIYINKTITTMDYIAMVNQQQRKTRSIKRIPTANNLTLFN